MNVPTATIFLLAKATLKTAANLLLIIEDRKPKNIPAHLFFKLPHVTY